MAGKHLSARYLLEKTRTLKKTDEKRSENALMKL